MASTPMDLVAPCSFDGSTTFNAEGLNIILKKVSSVSTTLRFGYNARAKDGDPTFTADTLRRPNLCKTFMALAKRIVGNPFGTMEIATATFIKNVARGPPSTKISAHGCVVICFRSVSAESMANPGHKSGFFALLRGIGEPLVVHGTEAVCAFTVPAGGAYAFGPTWDSRGALIVESMAALVLGCPPPRHGIGARTVMDLKTHGFPLTASPPLRSPAAGAASTAISTSHCSAPAAQMSKTMKILYEREVVKACPGMAQRRDEASRKRNERVEATGFCQHCTCQSCVNKKDAMAKKKARTA